METLQMEQSKPGTVKRDATQLELTRVIRTSRVKVYEAWTRPEVLQQWFGPGQMVVPSARLDAREGGEYAIEMAGSGSCEDQSPAATGSRFIRGVYQQVVPNERLQFTWRADWSGDETSLVTISFRDVEGGTEITLKHERFATESSRDGHEKGWGASLSKMATLLEG